MTTNPPLKVLFIEDSEDDTLMLVYNLQRSYHLSYERVDTAESMSDALDREQWDVIICDCILPNFSAMEALEVIQKKRIDLPFIMVSGAIDEEIASSILRAGAHDFVTKRRLARLIPAIERELREASIRRKQKQTEVALLHREEQFILALEAARMGTWDWNILTNQIIWSSGCEELLGLAEGTFGGTYESFLACVHPEDRKAVSQVVNNALNHQQNYQLELRVMWADGSIHWIETKGRFFYNTQGRAVRMVGIVMDISDRKLAEVAVSRAKAELEVKVIERTTELSQANDRLQQELYQRQQVVAALHEAERRWRSLMENVNLIVVGLDVNGKVEYVNPFFLELTEYTKVEVIGKNWFENFLPLQQKPRVEKSFQELIKDNFPPHYTNSILTKFGEERIIAWNNTLLRNSQGQVIGTLSIGEDITERYALERMKDEFTSVVSHELRTPLTSIHGALNLLSTGLVAPNSEKGQRIIEIASESAERLVRLVNDILELERLESGKISLSKQLCNTAVIITKAIETMQVMANRAEIELIASPQSIILEADPDRIIQVLTNLLSNAIKFSPQGSQVYLNVKLQESGLLLGSRGKAVLFQIEDLGRGIPQEKVETIFERFHQVDASDSRKKGGTGLGLAICRSIVHQHGGRIWVESILGQGSSFYFTLPLSKVEEKTYDNQAHLSH